MSNKITIDEPSLVARLKERDKVAFELLYDRYSSALYGVIMKVVNLDEIAEEVLQDVFIKIWNNLDSYDMSKGRLFTWLLNIARNTAIDKIRSKDFRNNSNIQSIDKSVYEVNNNWQTTIEVDHIGLKETLTKLKDTHRVVLDLVYYKGYTHEEAAEELQLPLGTVKTRIRSAIMQLRELLGTK